MKKIDLIANLELLKQYVEHFSAAVLRMTADVRDDREMVEQPGMFFGGLVYVWVNEEQIPKGERISEQFTSRSMFYVSTVVQHAGNRYEPPSEDFIDEKGFTHVVQAAEEVVRRFVALELQGIAVGMGEYGMYYEGLTPAEREKNGVPSSTYYKVRQVTQLTLHEPNGFERVVAQSERISFPTASERIAKQKFKRHAHRIT